MSNASIFAIGVFVTLLLGGGLAFTIYDMRRSYEKGLDTVTERAKSATKR